MTTLPVLADLDTVDDLPAVVESAPQSRTAVVARQLGLIAARPARNGPLKQEV